MTPDATTTANRRRIIIIGAGFGGLYAARSLNHQPVDVLLIDRHNYHTFTPLLYQVATSGLEPEQIAYPVRGIFHGSPNIRFLLGTVTAIDAATRRVIVEAEDGLREESYDALIVAGGSVTNTFGNTDLERHAFGLKDLQDAVGLRHHILRLFERAAWEEDAALRQALMTIVVVGGGPTGLETAAGCCGKTTPTWASFTPASSWSKPVTVCSPLIRRVYSSRPMSSCSRWAST